MRIAPIDHPWVHTYIAEPYLHGCDLINAAWSGKNVTVSLSLKERVIYWIQGALLMIPFVNTIIWIAWQTFGHPNNLTDSYNPEEDDTPVLVEHPPPHHGATPSTAVLPRPSRPTERIENFTFTEKKGDETTFMTWDVCYFADRIEVNQECSLFSAVSTYRSDYTLEKYVQEIQTNRYEMRQEGKRVYVHIGETVREVELEHPYPVVEDRALGLRGFILSEEREFHFYAMLFEPPIQISSASRPLQPFLKYMFSNLPYATASTATKCYEEEIPGYGRLLKIEVKPQHLIGRQFLKSEMWFDPSTGLLKKFVDTIPTKPLTIGELLQNNPLPAPVHPRSPARSPRAPHP